MKIVLGNQKATSLMHRKQSKTSIALSPVLPDHLTCRKLTSIPCSPIVVNQCQRLIKSAFPLIGSMLIEPWGAPGQKHIYPPQSSLWILSWPLLPQYAYNSQWSQTSPTTPCLSYMASSPMESYAPPLCLSSYRSGQTCSFSYLWCCSYSPSGQSSSATWKLAFA